MVVMSKKLTVPLLIVIATFISCSSETHSYFNNKIDESKNKSKHEAQLLSIKNALYRGSPEPPPPTKPELKRIKQLLKDPKHRYSAEVLRKHYGSNYDLMAYAYRDSDQDGVLDYRIASTINGRFYEGDIDIDGDGVRNTHDMNPYDPTVGLQDQNNNDIPDSIDWELTKSAQCKTRSSECAQLVTIQKELLLRYHVTLVERTADFPLVTAIAFKDALTKVFRKVTPQEGFYTLRTVASEAHAWLYPDDGETCAMVFGPSQSMMIYNGSLSTPPFLQLALIIHELGHSYQYNLDWDASNMAAEYRRQYFPMRRFKQVVKHFDWTPRAHNIYSDDETDTLFASLDKENKSDFLYRNKTKGYWSNWIQNIWEDTGDGYLDDPRVKSKHIVSEYSLSDPLEWYSEQLTAYILERVEQEALSQLKDDETRNDFSKWMAAQEQEVWPGFKHRNIRGSRSFSHLKKKFYLLKEDLKDLTQRYLFSNF